MLERHTASEIGQVPMLHEMSFDEIIAKDMVVLGGAETVANAILRPSSELGLMGLAVIFKLGAMPYDMVHRPCLQRARSVQQVP